MSDVLSLHPESEEILEFRQSERDVWPFGGMSCKVVGCPVTKTFTKFGRYMDHWTEYHQPTVQLLACSACKRVYPKLRRAAANQHIKHHAGQPSPTLKQETTGNRKFINPKDILPPRINKIHVNEREQARQQRSQSTTVSVNKQEREQMELDYLEMINSA